MLKVVTAIPYVCTGLCGTLEIVWSMLSDHLLLTFDVLLGNCDTLLLRETVSVSANLFKFSLRAI